jgi:serine/threonine-protein kinase RsbW
VRNGETDRTEFARLEAAAHPGALRGLRREMRRFLAPLPLGSDRCDEVVLAVDEATANAVDHAYDSGKPGTVEVTFWTEADALYVEVSDHGHWREPAVASAGRGRGITLLRQLIDCVLIHHDARGTRVLLRHPINRPAPDHDLRAPATPGSGAHPLSEAAR